MSSTASASENTQEMSTSTRSLLTRVRQIIPPLAEWMHKGQQGRIAVIGGSEDYTGAPFFACNAAALLGADMAHVICEPLAAQVIKTYSPNLMVHPYMRASNHTSSNDDVASAQAKLDSLLERVHSIVVGPGLGRDDLMLETAGKAIEKAKSLGLGVVLDADGLFLLQHKKELLKGYRKAVITPNKMEFMRLCKSFGVEMTSDQPSETQRDGGEDCKRLAQALDGVTVVQKGRVDWISNGKRTICCEMQGGLKRSGGQGDTLSGSLVTMLAWKRAYQEGLWKHDNKLEEEELMFLTAYGACAITRLCSRKAYEKKGRALQASDLPLELPEAFKTLYEGELPEEDWLNQRDPKEQK
ncbi:carbohydrate kinase [Ascobolus immersus RN42]|uniref:ATP-dependent (S)-NAD(P)H-hydrate dehydratase n=1 Tax=Ascobolus immersus RN42 TaxID=1160509 RepID=A0A3N4HBD3_ASCIM|nr:carbohydrate kinase [Ascobolus immersus RN42]